MLLLLFSKIQMNRVLEHDCSLTMCTQSVILKSQFKKKTLSSDGILKLQCIVNRKDLNSIRLRYIFCSIIITNSCISSGPTSNKAFAAN